MNLYVAKLFSLAFFILFVGCDGLFEIKGIVQDQEGRPIPDALVTFSKNHEYQTKTDNNGSFSIGYVSGSDRHQKGDISASKEGYESSSFEARSANISHSRDESPVIIVLKRLEDSDAKDEH